MNPSSNLTNTQWRLAQELKRAEAIAESCTRITDPLEDRPTAELSAPDTAPLDIREAIRIAARFEENRAKARRRVAIQEQLLKNAALRERMAA